MICYTVRCHAGHNFEGWYRDSKTYESLQAAGAIVCPECGSRDVRRAPMAPALSGTKASRRNDALFHEASEEAPSADAPETHATPTVTPVSAEDAKRIHVMGKIREAMVEMRRHVEKNADYGGPKFAEEARKIHYGETEERSIYGEATNKESEALKEEGIEFGQIPWVPETDA